MDTGSRYLHLDSSVTELVRQLIRAIEGLQAQPESVAAGVQPQEAAPTAIELGRSAGRVPGLIEVLEYAKERRDYLSTKPNNPRCVAQRVEVENLIYWIEFRIVEARR